MHKFCFNALECVLIPTCSRAVLRYKGTHIIASKIPSFHFYIHRVEENSCSG